MATKGEKIFGTLIGSIVGAVSAYNYAKNNDIPEEDRWKYTLGGGVGGAAGGYGFAALFGSSNNTVNYKLMNKRKRVYDGITYEHRIPERKAEHIRSGKVFTEMVVDNSKPRIEALELEKTLIKKHRGDYNIQHNI